MQLQVRAYSRNAIRWSQLTEKLSGMASGDPTLGDVKREETKSSTSETAWLPSLCPCKPRQANARPCTLGRRSSSRSVSCRLSSSISVLVGCVFIDPKPTMKTRFLLQLNNSFVALRLPCRMCAACISFKISRNADLEEDQDADQDRFQRSYKVAHFCCSSSEM